MRIYPTETSAANHLAAWLTRRPKRAARSPHVGDPGGRPFTKEPQQATAHAYVVTDVYYIYVYVEY